MNGVKIIVYPCLNLSLSLSMYVCLSVQMEAETPFKHSDVAFALQLSRLLVLHGFCAGVRGTLKTQLSILQGFTRSEERKEGIFLYICRYSSGWLLYCHYQGALDDDAAIQDSFIYL